MRQFDVVIKHK